MVIAQLEILRKARGITQDALVKKVNISIMTYHRYAKGERAPDVHTAIRLADELGVDNYDSFKELYALPNGSSIRK